MWATTANARPAVQWFSSVITLMMDVTSHCSGRTQQQTSGRLSQLSDKELPNTSCYMFKGVINLKFTTVRNESDTTSRDYCPTAVREKILANVGKHLLPTQKHCFADYRQQYLINYISQYFLNTLQPIFEQRPVLFLLICFPKAQTLTTKCLPVIHHSQPSRCCCLFSGDCEESPTGDFWYV